MSKNIKLSKSEQSVVDLVTKHPGDNSSSIVWRKLGGGFSNGRAVGTINNITPDQLVVALKIPARVSKLANQLHATNGTVLHRGKGAINMIVNGSSNEGYWPSAGSYRARSNNRFAYPAVAPQQSKPKPTVKPEAMKQGVDELAEFLK